MICFDRFHLKTRADLLLFNGQCTVCSPTHPFQPRALKCHMSLSILFDGISTLLGQMSSTRCYWLRAKQIHQPVIKCKFISLEESVTCPGEKCSQIGIYHPWRKMDGVSHLFLFIFLHQRFLCVYSCPLKPRAKRANNDVIVRVYYRPPKKGGTQLKISFYWWCGGGMLNNVLATPILRGKQKSALS